MRSRLCVLSLALLVASCAAKTPVMPPPPAAPLHPEFRYPTVPEGTDSIQSTRIERGWHYLQADSFRNAEREFEAALKLQPLFYPAEAALGYLQLAQKEPKDAVTRFDRALQTASTYTPALLGRGRALLELGRDGEALVSLEAALKSDPSLTDLQGRIEVLRFRALQDSLARARAATDAGNWDDARAAYNQALAASPESAFLYRDLATVEGKAGQPNVALEHFRKAVALDPTDARSHAQIASILEEQGDAASALAAYEKALAIDPSEVPADRLTRLREATALSKLPEQYRAISGAEAVTRGDLAALIGVRLGPLLAQANQQQAVVTDLRGHWAQQWILPVVRAGVMETQPNYTFQPGGRVRRGELAQIVARLLNLVAASNPSRASRWQKAETQIPDVPPTHLSYPAVSQVLASGVMPLTPNGTFQLLNPVSGAEAVEILGRVEALAKP